MMSNIPIGLVASEVSRLDRELFTSLDEEDENIPPQSAVLVTPQALQLPHDYPSASSPTRAAADPPAAPEQPFRPGFMPTRDLPLRSAPLPHSHSHSHSQSHQHQHFSLARSVAPEPVSLQSSPAHQAQPPAPAAAHSLHRPSLSISTTYVPPKKARPKKPENEVLASFSSSPPVPRPHYSSRLNGQIAIPSDQLSTPALTEPGFSDQQPDELSSPVTEFVTSEADFPPLSPVSFRSHKPTTHSMSYFHNPADGLTRQPNDQHYQRVYDPRTAGPGPGPGPGNFTPFSGPPGGYHFPPVTPSEPVSPRGYPSSPSHGNLTRLRRLSQDPREKAAYVFTSMPSDADSVAVASPVDSLPPRRFHTPAGSKPTSPVSASARIEHFRIRNNEPTNFGFSWIHSQDSPQSVSGHYPPQTHSGRHTNRVSLKTPIQMQIKNEPTQIVALERNAYATPAPELGHVSPMRVPTPHHIRHPTADLPLRRADERPTWPQRSSSASLRSRAEAMSEKPLTITVVSPNSPLLAPPTADSLRVSGTIAPQMITVPSSPQEPLAMTLFAPSLSAQLPLSPRSPIHIEPLQFEAYRRMQEEAEAEQRVKQSAKPMLQRRPSHNVSQSVPNTAPLPGTTFDRSAHPPLGPLTYQPARAGTPSASLPAPHLPYDPKPSETALLKRSVSYNSSTRPAISKGKLARHMSDVSQTSKPSLSKSLSVLATIHGEGGMTSTVASALISQFSGESSGACSSLESESESNDEASSDPKVQIKKLMTRQQRLQAKDLKIRLKIHKLQQQVQQSENGSLALPQGSAISSKTGSSTSGLSDKSSARTGPSLSTPGPMLRSDVPYVAPMIVKPPRLDGLPSMQQMLDSYHQRPTPAVQKSASSKRSSRMNEEEKADAGNRASVTIIPPEEEATRSRTAAAQRDCPKVCNSGSTVTTSTVYDPEQESHRATVEHTRSQEKCTCTPQPAAVASPEADEPAPARGWLHSLFSWGCITPSRDNSLDDCDLDDYDVDDPASAAADIESGFSRAEQPDDLSTCLTGLICAPVLHNRTRHRFNQVVRRVNRASRALPPDATIPGPAALPAPLPSVSSASPAALRSAVRAHYNIPGSAATDALAAIFCSCCAIIQVEREVREQEAAAVREERRRRHAATTAAAARARACAVHAHKPRADSAGPQDREKAADEGGAGKAVGALGKVPTVLLPPQEDSEQPSGRTSPSPGTATGYTSPVPMIGFDPTLAPVTVSSEYIAGRSEER